MSSLAGPLSGIPAPADLWDASAATGLDGLGALVHRSNLLGADRSVANQGGGNTSAKGVVVDHAGREQRVLWVKGSGTDLATITGDGFAALLLDEVEPLRSRQAMDDASMVDYLRRCALEPDQPRPSIETLLHAFVDAAHVDHTHPDAVIALTSTPNGRSLADRGVRRRGGLARLSAPGLRHVEADRRAPRRASVRPCRPARAPRPRHVGQHLRGGLQEHHRVRHESCRGGGQGRSRPVRPGRQGERGARGERVPRPPGADASRAPRLAPRRCGRRRARGRPEPRGGRVRLVGASLRGEPGRRAVPRPPDQHEAQAARGRVRPGERRPRRPRRRPATRCRGVRRVVPRVLREARRRRDPAVPHGSGRPAGHPDPRCRRGDERARCRRRRGRRATSTTARSRSRTPPTRSVDSGPSARRRPSRSSTGRSSATSSRRRRRPGSSRAASP